MLILITDTYLRRQKKKKKKIRVYINICLLILTQFVKSTQNFSTSQRVLLTTAYGLVIFGDLFLILGST